MSSLNVDENYFENIKTKRLKLRLGPIADLIPLRLWCHAAKHCPEDGVFKGYSSEELAMVAGYDGDASSMLAALLEFGFLVKVNNTSYKIHQWEEHQGHIISFKRRGKANAQKRWGLNTKNASSNASSNADSNAPTRLTIPTKLTKEHSASKPVSEQARFIAKFADLYLEHAGMPYDIKKTDYVLVAGLIKKHTVAVVQLKTELLLNLCEKKEAWFTKDGFGSFTISTLVKHFNSIVKPEETSTFERFYGKAES